MNQRELFEKIYNREIDKDTVIVKKHVEEEEEISYILNDGYEFWGYESENVSLNIFKKNEDYEYDIISKDEFIRITDEKERDAKIERLKKQLSELEAEKNFSVPVTKIIVKGFKQL